MFSTHSNRGRGVSYSLPEDASKIARESAFAYELRSFPLTRNCSARSRSDDTCYTSACPSSVYATQRAADCLRAPGSGHDQDPVGRCLHTHVTPIRTCWRRTKVHGPFGALDSGISPRHFVLPPMDAPGRVRRAGKSPLPELESSRDVSAIARIAPTVSVVSKTSRVKRRPVPRSTGEHVCSCLSGPRRGCWR